MLAFSSSASSEHETPSTSLLCTMGILARPLAYAAGLGFLALTLLSPRSSRARFYLNSSLYLSSLGVCSVWGVLVSIWMTALPGLSRFNINLVIARSFYFLAGSLIGFRFEVEGEEYLEKDRPYVMVGNHQSGIDILYLGRIFPGYASIMAKKELKYAPLLGQYMTLSGAVFINRRNKEDAVKTFARVGDDMKRKKISLWVFPEGTRSSLPYPGLLPFKKGAFHLAVQAQVPIVPVVCENYWRLFDGRSRFEGGTIRIKVLEPISTQGLTAADVNSLTERARNAMLAALQQMDADRDAFDSAPKTHNSSLGSTSSIAAPPTSIRPYKLGGLAGLASKIVGTSTGSLHAVALAAKTERARLEAQRQGKDGLPQEYGLLSESDAKAEAKAQGTAPPGSSAALPADRVAEDRGVKAEGARVTDAASGETLRRRRDGKEGGNNGGGDRLSWSENSSEELVDEDGAVVVKRPSGQA